MTTTAANLATYAAMYPEILVDLGAPRTSVSLSAFACWQSQENANAKFNPLDTEQPALGATKYNPQGVRDYINFDQGVRATVTTLKNGHYPRILAALHRGVDGLAICTAIDASPWGTHGVANEWVRRHGHHPPPTPHTYTVHAGDTLAAIATRLHIAGGWQHLYTANRAVIGHDPNLIHPGEILVIP